MNCFVAYVNTNKGEPYLLLDSLDGDVVKCRRWDEKSFSIETENSLHDLVNAELEVLHYYGLHKFTFTGMWEVLWHRYTGSVYIGVNLRLAWLAGLQFLFNRRSLPSQRRLRVLRLLVSSRLAGSIGWMTSFNSENIGGMTSFDIMTELYSIRWTEHPENQSRRLELEFLLESLRASEDVEKIGIKYRATPKSLVTLDLIDEQDRRHREASRIQVGIAILTLIIALAAIVQTGVVKLPTFFVFGAVSEKGKQ